MTTMLAELANRELVVEELWGRVSARIRKDPAFQSHFGELDETEQIAWAERILNETLGFLQFYAFNRSAWGPSELVDIGWHVFLVYTKEYAAFCMEVAEQFIHHAPNDVPGVKSVSHAPAVTMRAMQQAGFTIDPELWSLNAVDCESRPGPHCGGRCTCA